MWNPISLQDLNALIIESVSEFDAVQTRLWHAIKIAPAKWELHPWGDEGGGFWAVGLIGRNVIWYNDIEDGFNISSFSTYGTIDAYYCNQGSLQPVVYDLIQWLMAGDIPSARLGPPVPISDP
ncbi:hypothetical protein SH449x_004709 [Pirellulaceae bacterium SH449]|jgi:hypothetical protein